MAFKFHIVNTARKGPTMTITWLIKPLSTPTVLRNCSRCGCPGEFECSSKFRVNAQQRNIDVWLIYKCKKCASTWNMTVLSRVSPQDIGGELYNGFLENNADLAFNYAFDQELHRKNGVRACYDSVAYDVEGARLNLETLNGEDVTLCIKSPYNLQLRLDKLLRDSLGLSRSYLEKYIRDGAITLQDAALTPERTRIVLKGDMTLNLHIPASSSADTLAAP